MSKVRVYVVRLFIIAISVALINNLIITYVNTERKSFSESTTVGNVYLGGLPKNNINEYIQPKVDNYLNKLEIKYTYNNETYTSSVDFVEYNEDLTLSTIIDGKSSNYVFTINENKLKLLLSKNLPKYIFNNIDYDKLSNDLRSYYTQLKTKVDVYINDYIIDFDALKEELNTYTYLLNGEIDEVDDFIERLEDIDITIEANERFSLLETFKSRVLTSNELNVLATGINAISINTNFSSYIKSNSRIPYTKLNHEIEVIETSVNKTQDKDFSFYNPYDYTFDIRIEKADGGLKFTLIGLPFEHQYEYMVEEESIPYIPLSEDVVIPKGATRIIGVDGKEIKVYRYIKDNNQIKNKVLLYTNYFGPRNETFEE